MNIFSGPRVLHLELSILFDSFWCYSRRTVVHIRPAYIFSVPRVLDHELSIHTYWLTLLLQPYISPCMTYWTYFWKINPQSWTFYTYWLYVSHRVLEIWPNGFISGPRLLESELFIHFYSLLLILLHPYRSQY